MSDDPQGATPPDDDAETSTLSRTFAVMLGELEDAETALVVREKAILGQLAEVQGELDRVQAVKAAMMGQPKGKRRKARTTTADSPSASVRGANGSGDLSPKARALVEFAKGRDGDDWSAADAAEALGDEAQSYSPVIASLKRRALIRETREEPRPGGNTKSPIRFYEYAGE